MTQETLVLRVAPARAAALRARFAEAAFEFRSVPHALFSVKGEGVVATLYSSGKFVVQGPDPARFAEQWLAGAGAKPVVRKSEPAATHATHDDLPLVGSDECGKGDYFGPLVVCAVRLEPAQTAELRGSQVRDSKTLNDEACLRLGAALRSRYAYAIEKLDPPEYNATWKRPGQLNQMLADLHAKAIRRLARPGDHALVDKFADEKLVASRLADLDLHLEQRVRAESVPAVAAASIIAREAFLEALKQLSDEAAVHLAKGAGDPTDRAAREYVKLHGFEGLGKVAKLHFKNTQKLQR